MILIAEARPPRLPIEPELLDTAAPLPIDPVRQLQVRAVRLQPWLEQRLLASSADRKAFWGWLCARNRQRWEPDRVTIRLADKSIIDFHEGGKRPSFRLAHAETATADYADIFTPDGRIMTRLTARRRAILDKLFANETLTSAAQTYWYKRSGTNRGGHPDRAASARGRTLGATRNDFARARVAGTESAGDARRWPPSLQGGKYHFGWPRWTAPRCKRGREPGIRSRFFPAWKPSAGQGVWRSDDCDVPECGRIRPQPYNVHRYGNDVRTAPTCRNYPSIFYLSRAFTGSSMPLLAECRFSI
jgi:hypothetical protein